MTATDLRRELKEVLKSVENGSAPVKVTRHKKVVAAVIGSTDLDLLERFHTQAGTKGWTVLHKDPKAEPTFSKDDLSDKSTLKQDSAYETKLTELNVALEAYGNIAPAPLVSGTEYIVEHDVVVPASPSREAQIRVVTASLLNKAPDSDLRLYQELLNAELLSRLEKSTLSSEEKAALSAPTGLDIELKSGTSYEVEHDVGPEPKDSSSDSAPVNNADLFPKDAEAIVTSFVTE